MMKKRRHHYIWKYYLKAWSEDNKIWTSISGDIQRPNIDKVGVITDFYKLKELIPEDIEIINKLMFEDSQPHLIEINKKWVDLFTQIHKIKNKKAEDIINNENIDKLLDDAIYNFEEEIHSKIELIAINHINSIRKGNIDFYKSEKGIIEFSDYICTQYSRTRKVKDSVIQKIKGPTIERIWNVLSHIFATNISWALFSEREKYRLYLLVNNVLEEFITSDQPVINTFATNKMPDEPTNELEFFYPVSPMYAILISSQKTDWNEDKIILTAKEIVDYNKMMVQQSHTQIYGRTKTILEKYTL